MSNFQKTVEFNRVFGNEVPNTIQKDVFKHKIKDVKSRLALVTEEVQELVDGVENNDLKEVIDALSDILVVTYGMGSFLGVDLDVTFDIVHKSNMSKLCKTEQEAIETVEWYLKNEQRYDSPAYKKSYDDKYWIVYNKSTNKILKNHSVLNSYTPANFDSLLE